MLTEEFCLSSASSSNSLPTILFLLFRLRYSLGPIKSRNNVICKVTLQTAMTFKLVACYQKHNPVDCYDLLVGGEVPSY
jgi:hypothetical protein